MVIAIAAHEAIHLGGFGAWGIDCLGGVCQAGGSPGRERQAEHSWQQAAEVDGVDAHRRGGMDRHKLSSQAHLSSH
jgi:hypothetical protein